MKVTLIALSVMMLGFGTPLAQAETDGRFLQHAEETDLRASELVGATVYVSQTDVAATTIDGVPGDWESVANVDDVVFSHDGQIRGVLVDVGGFLGIGARTVMVSMDALNFVREHDGDDVYVVFTSTREELENAPEYQDDTMVREMTEEDRRAEEERRAEAERRAAEEGRVGVPAEPAAGFQRVEWGTLTVDDLQGATVYDRFNERVSGINDIVLSEGGTEVVAVLIDVGGFLGIGARTVAVYIDQLEIQYDPQVDDVRVYLAMTESELENLPEYQR